MPFEFRTRRSLARLTSDALEEQWAGHLEIGRAQAHISGSLYDSDGLTSSNQRETAAVLRSLLHFRPILLRYGIRAMTVRSDNSVTVFNLQRQGAGIALLQLTRKIFSLLLKLDIRITSCHIPGKENTLTDALSRIHATGDYALRQDVYDHATRAMHVAPTIDFFATQENTKCRRFVTWKGPSHPRDAFSMPRWDNGLPYLFPPVQLLPRVLQRIRDERVKAVVVLPKWPSRAWWGVFRPLAKVVVELGSEKQVLIPGPEMRASPTKKELPPGLFLMALLAPPPTYATASI
jgi:hypothetical protein